MILQCLILARDLFQIKSFWILLRRFRNWVGGFLIVEIYKVLEIAKILNICILPTIVRALPSQHIRQSFILLITEKKL